jgi:hypothetical protein
VVDGWMDGWMVQGNGLAKAGRRSGRAWVAQADSTQSWSSHCCWCCCKRCIISESIFILGGVALTSGEHGRRTEVAEERGHGKAGRYPAAQQRQRAEATSIGWWLEMKRVSTANSPTVHATQRLSAVVVCSSL